MLPSAKDIEQALKPKGLIFGFTLHNIPTMNLRHQYALDREIVFAEGLADTIEAWKFRRTTGATVTYPDPDSYFTTLLRSTIVGIECTLHNLTIQELAFSRRLTEEIIQAIRHPNGLSRSMAEAYYNKMPEHVVEDGGLNKHNNELWKTVQQFYREIRNPISHGYQLSDVKAESLRAVFNMFDEIYRWIDSWSDPHLVQKILSSNRLHKL